MLAFGVGGFVTFNAFMPDYSVTVGLDGSKWVFATYAGVCLLIRVVGATVPDRIGHARAVSIAMSLMATGLAMLFVWPHPLGVFISTVIIGIGISFNYPVAHGHDGRMQFPSANEVRAISTFTMFFEIGTATGALMFGILADLTYQADSVPRRRSVLLSSDWSCCGRWRCRDRGHTWLSDFR